ncbi:MAG: hypothetical protein ACFE0J_25075 [Elainellaceae cyanobacterium]
MSIFTPTRRGNPCQICGDTTGKCRETDQTLLCMNVTDASQPMPGFTFIGRTKDDLWGKWIANTIANNRESRQKLRTAQNRNSGQQSQRQRNRSKISQHDRLDSLSTHERDRQYRPILNQLTLHPDDRADLHRRGLTDDLIDRWGFKSVEQWQSLEQTFPSSLAGISANGRSLNTPFPGYLCPIYDTEERITGFQVRNRALEPNTPKYYWLTSRTKSNPDGATPHLGNGELPLAVYSPNQPPKRQAIALVEGTGPKPLLTAHRLGIVTIGAAGGQFSNSPQMLRQILDETARQFDQKIVEFYPDAGAICNPHVLRQYRATWRLLKCWGYTIQVMWWKQFTKADPDIDELSDLDSINSITDAEFDAIARHPEQILTQLTTLFRLEKGKQKKRQRRQSAHSPSSSADETLAIQTYQPGMRLQTWKGAIANGYRYILDSSTTGTGKSFDAGNATLDLADDVRQIIYLSDQHRNPTVDTLKIQNGWVDLDARHDGLIRETTVNGQIRLRRPLRREIPDTPANCSRTSVISTLRAKHVDGADTASLICGTCPLRDRCAQSKGVGYGFLSQRQSALASPKFRAHPDSLPAPMEYQYDSVVAIWDEPGQTFQVKHDIHVTLDDLEQVITSLLKTPEQFETIQPLLTALLPYLDGSMHLGKFGLTHTQVVDFLPNLGTLDISAIEHVLVPNLSFLNKVDQDKTNPGDRPQSHSLAGDDRVIEHAENSVVKQWLPTLLRVLTGQIQGALSIKQGLLTIALPDTHHRAIAGASKATIFLDATLTRDDLALKLGCSPDEILEIRQEMSRPENLVITQVTDLGRMGMQRGKQQQQRTKILVEHYKQRDPTTKVIDFKKYHGDGAWWRDSRGVNDFTEINTLILVGTPCRNIIDQAAEYAILTGAYDLDNQGFKAFVDRAIQADFYQAIGRLRAHRRLSEQLQVVILSNFELDLSTHHVSASDVTPEASTKQERFVAAALHAMNHLTDQNKKVTQTAIAKLTGYSQQYLSRFWKLLLMLLKESNSASGRVSQAEIHAPDSVVQNTSQLTAILNRPDEPAPKTEIPHLLEKLNDMFQQLTVRQWRQVWNRLSASEHIKILSILLSTLPIGQIKCAVQAFI